jgi:hypothetical protein
MFSATTFNLTCYTRGVFDANTDFFFSEILVETGLAASTTAAKN